MCANFKKLSIQSLKASSLVIIAHDMGNRGVALASSDPVSVPPKRRFKYMERTEASMKAKLSSFDRQVGRHCGNASSFLIG